MDWPVDLARKWGCIYFQILKYLGTYPMPISYQVYPLGSCISSGKKSTANNSKDFRTAILPRFNRSTWVRWSPPDTEAD